MFIHLYSVEILNHMLATQLQKPDTQVPLKPSIYSLSQLPTSLLSFSTFNEDHDQIQYHFSLTE